MKHERHEKITIARYYRNTEHEHIVNLCRPSNIVLHNISVVGAKARLTRDARANGFQPIGNWCYKSFSNDWTREFVKGAKTVTGMVHLFD